MRELTKERLWLYIAVVGLLLMFAHHSVLEVKSDEVIASEISFWFYKHEIRKINVSDVGEVRVRSKYIGRAGWIPSLLVNTKRGERFYSLSYHNGLTGHQSCERDKEILKKALAEGTDFRVSQNESFPWIVLVVVSLFVYIYKRSWRLEMERLSRNGLRPVAEDATAKFSPSRTFRFKLRNVNGNNRHGVKR